MAQIDSTENYYISTLDGSDLYLTATSSGSTVALTTYDATNQQQIWSLDTSNELFTSDPGSSASLYIVADTDPCTTQNSQPSTRNYFIIDGDDTNGYTIQWWSIDPESTGSSLGYIARNGNVIKNDPNTDRPQKWKFTKTTNRVQGWEKPPR